MANQNVSMKKIKKFLQRYQAGNSLRQISSMTRMSRNTICKYKEMPDKHPLSYKELIQCSDKGLFATDISSRYFLKYATDAQ